MYVNVRIQTRFVEACLHISEIVPQSHSQIGISTIESDLIEESSGTCLH